MEATAILREYFQLEGESVTELSALHVKALRAANRILFRHSENGVPAHMRISVRERGTFGEIESDVYVVCESYIADHGKPRDRQYAWVSVYAEQISGFISALRKGDTVHLRWCASNNTPALTGALLHADELRAVVYRAGARKGEYLLAYQVSADNTARMCRADR